jgi:hypothetical protein
MDYDEWFFPLDVNRYDYITKIYSNNYNLENEGINKKTIVLINIDKKELVLSKWKDILDKVDISKILETILTYDSDYQWKNSKEEMTFIINSKKYNYKLFIQNISFPNPDYKNTNWNDKMINWIWYNTSWYALIKKLK